MASKVKNLMLVGAFGLVGLALSCGEVQIQETIDPEVQLAEDIAIIEEYLASKDIVDYDTLESEVRVVIMELGDGEPIAYQDIVWYDYIGRFTNDQIFDTSIGSLALEQDQSKVIDTVFLKSQANPELDSLDDDGEKIIEDINYEDGYFPIYSEIRDYEPFFTTHTPGGWFIQQENALTGFKDGVHAVLEEVNLNGRGIALLPSVEAYGVAGSFPVIDPNTVILFELIPVRKK